MTALTADKDAGEQLGTEFTSPVKASTTVYLGSLLAQDSDGDAAPITTATTWRALGVAMEQVDNSAGADGDLSVRYRKGVFKFVNSAAADEIAESEKGEICYAVDDQTVAKTNGSSTRSVAGVVIGVDAADGLVMVAVGAATNVDGDLVAANNLSDVANAATSRSNIGANVLQVNMPQVAALDGAATIRLVMQVAGTITTISSTITGALTGGDPTLTGEINGTPITTGVITIANAASAAGDIDTVTPSAANVVAIGDEVTFIVAANSQTNVEVALVSFLLTT